MLKLKYLDDYITARIAVADYYDRAFANHPKITTPFRSAFSTHVFHQYTLTLNDVDRDGLNACLAEPQYSFDAVLPGARTQAKDV